MAFAKGQSGNPGGRPKGLARLVRDLIAAKVEEDPVLGKIDGWAAITLRLYEVAIGRKECPEKDRLAAAKLLYDRAGGLPRQEVEVSGGVTPEQAALVEALKMSPHERAQRIAELRATEAQEPESDDGSDDEG